MVDKAKNFGVKFTYLNLTLERDFSILFDLILS